MRYVTLQALNKNPYWYEDVKGGPNDRYFEWIFTTIRRNLKVLFEYEYCARS
jgi:hypothetical protein